MVELLKTLRNDYCLIGIKAELEVEAAMPDDLHRLKEITMAADVPITFKIGGCEAVSDMAQARMLGVDKLVAPMIESAFALEKFVNAANCLFGSDELEDMSLVANIETITAFNAYDEMLSLPQFGDLTGISIGRKDLTMSMKLARDKIDSEEVFKVCYEIISRTKEKYPACMCTIGGINGSQSIECLKRFEKNIDAFETRKVITDARVLSSEKAIEGFKKSLEFELMWYKTKSEHYQELSTIDCGYTQRIENIFNSM
jgi:hypothetical protein